MSHHLKSVDPKILGLARPTDEEQAVGLQNMVLSQSDPGYHINWNYLAASAPPWFSRELLVGLRRAHLRLLDEIAGQPATENRYQIMASDRAGVFSLGGDLGLMAAAIRQGDRQSVARYAHLCLDLVLQLVDSGRRNLTSIALVQGAAMGGGFEAALAHEYIVAERGVRFGFPEVHFNLFPGMGAYTLLKRRVGEAMAENMIVSGHTYSAEALHELGVVNMLAEPGNGVDAALLLVRKLESRASGARAFRRAVRCNHEADRAEMVSILNAWIDQAMTLSERDLRTMDFMRRSQLHKLSLAS